MNWWLALCFLIAAPCVLVVGFLISESWYDVKENNWDKDA